MARQIGRGGGGVEGIGYEWVESYQILITLMFTFWGDELNVAIFIPLLMIKIKNGFPLRENLTLGSKRIEEWKIKLCTFVLQEGIKTSY